jgi:hypothetical protein
MKDYFFTKMVAVIVGTLTIVAAIGLGILSFIGMGLSNAFNSGQEPSATSGFALIIVIILLCFGLFTGIGSFWLRGKVWRAFYMGFCIILGIGFVVVFFISFGALGFKNEIFLLCIGIIYLWLGYLVKRKK